MLYALLQSNVLGTRPLQSPTALSTATALRQRPSAQSRFESFAHLSILQLIKTRKGSGQAGSAQGGNDACGRNTTSAGYQGPGLLAVPPLEGTLWLNSGKGARFDVRNRLNPRRRISRLIHSFI